VEAAAALADIRPPYVGRKQATRCPTRVSISYEGRQISGGTRLPAFGLLVVRKNATTHRSFVSPAYVAREPEQCLIVEAATVEKRTILTR